MLQCHSRECRTTSGSASFPLQLAEIELDTVETEFNPDFLRHFLPKIQWEAAYSAAIQIGNDSLPKEMPEELDDDFLLNLHEVLLQTDVKAGKMKCNGCGHVYPITDGIPNMLLQETEI